MLVRTHLVLSAASLLAVFGCQKISASDQLRPPTLASSRNALAGPLTPEQRKQFEQRYEAMSPEERAQLQGEFQAAYENLSAQERAELDRRLSAAYQALSPELRNALEADLTAAYRRAPAEARKRIEAIAPFLKTALQQSLHEGKPPGKERPGVVQALAEAVGADAERSLIADVPGSFVRASPPKRDSSPISGFVDLDHDGLPDSFEADVAEAFTPYYHVSAGENDVFITLEDRVPMAIRQRFASVPPISHFRVQPLGFVTTDREYGVLRIDYLTEWDRDDGLDVSGTCIARMAISLGLIGVDVAFFLNGIAWHDLDWERSAALVAAPTPSPGVFSFDWTAYKGYSYYTAAHEGTPSDSSFFIVPSRPVDAGLHLEMYLSRSKHGTYVFNPNGWRLIPGWIIGSAHVVVDFLYAIGEIDFLRWGILHFIIDSADSCISESFSDRGGSFAAIRTNVGEPDTPMPGQSWIGDQRISNQLRPPLWIILGGSCRPGSCAGIACGLSDGCGGTCCAGSGCTVANCGSCRMPNACGSSCVPAFDGAACTTPTGDPSVCQNGACLCGCLGRTCGQTDTCGSGEICCAGSGCTTVGCGVCQMPDACGGTCVPSPDGTPCPGGTCFGGQCMPG